MQAEENVQILASITFLDGPLIHQTLPITKPITTIGRNSDNDIIINDQRISRFHARLLKNDETWEIEKLSKSLDVSVDDQHTLNYLLFTWLALIATILILSVLTAYFLKRKDNNG